MTPPLHFSQASTLYSTIPLYKSVFSFVLDHSFVRTKDSPKDSIHTSEDTEDPDPSVSCTTSVPTLFYQSPQDWPGLTRANLVKFAQELMGSTLANLSNVPKLREPGPVISCNLRTHHTGTSSPGSTSQSIRLTRNLRVYSYNTLVNKSARFFLVGM